MSTATSNDAACSPTSWTERIVRRVAGTLVLVSLALATWVHPGWMALGAFVGLNLFQSSFTGFCPLENVLHRFERAHTSPVSSS